jgi:hypothetical protein
MHARSERRRPDYLRFFIIMGGAPLHSAIAGLAAAPQGHSFSWLALWRSQFVVIP